MTIYDLERNDVDWVLNGLGDAPLFSGDDPPKKRRWSGLQLQQIRAFTDRLPVISFESRFPTLRIGLLNPGDSLARVYDVSNPQRPVAVGPVYVRTKRDRASLKAADDIRRFYDSRAYLDSRVGMEPDLPDKSHGFETDVEEKNRRITKKRKRAATPAAEDEFTRLSRTLPAVHHPTPLPGARYGQWPDTTWHVYDVRSAPVRAVGPGFHTSNQLDAEARKYATIEEFERAWPRTVAAFEPTASQRADFPYRLIPLVRGIAYAKVSDDPERWTFVDVRNDDREPFGPEFSAESALMDFYDRAAREASDLKTPEAKVRRIRRLIMFPEQEDERKERKRAAHEEQERVDRDERERKRAARAEQERADREAERERVRAERRAKSGREPFIVMMNPKTFDLVEMYRKGTDYRMGFFGDRDACIGDAYTAENEDVGDYSYRRIHSPGHCRGQSADFEGVNSDYRGQGYGFLLYSGTAAGVFLETEDNGVFSVSGTRSDQAEDLWQTLVDRGIADEHGGYGEVDEEDTVNYCCEIEANEGESFVVRRRGWVDTREICDDVDVIRTVEGSNTINTIDGGDILERSFVLWHLKTKDGDGQEKVPPADLVVRLKVHNLEALKKLQTYIRDHFESDIYEAFMARDDVLEILGQERLPGVSGPETSRKVPLPPLSAESKKIISEFEQLAVDIPDGEDLEGPPPVRRCGKRKKDPVGSRALSGPIAGSDLSGPDLAAGTRTDALIERAQLWREQERIAFRRGAYRGWTEAQARKRQTEIDLRLAELDKELVLVRGRRDLGDLDRHSFSIVLGLGLAAGFLGGMVYVFVRARQAQTAVAGFVQVPDFWPDAPPPEGSPS